MAVTRQQKNGDPMTLVDKAYERIKADFARGALAPGEKSFSATWWNVTVSVKRRSSRR